MWLYRYSMPSPCGGDFPFGLIRPSNANQHLRRQPIAVQSSENEEPQGLRMNVIEKPPPSARAATLDLDHFRLRRFIESLAGTDELERRDAPVDLADIAKVLDGNPRVV